MIANLIASIAWTLPALLLVGMVVIFSAWLSLAILFLGRMESGTAAIMAALWAVPIGLAAMMGSIPLLMQGIAMVAPENAYLVPFGVFLVTFFGFAAGLTWLALNKNEFQASLRRNKGRLGERQVAKVLAKAGFRAAHGLYVTNGKEVAQIDHLVEAGGSVLVLETKNWPGEILGRPSDEYWTRKFSDKDTTPVRNPIPQVRRQVRILSGLGPGKVGGLVVFARNARLLHGRVDGAIELGDLVRYLHRMREDVPATQETSEAWDGLVGRIVAQGQDELRERHARLFDPEALESVDMEGIRQTSQAIAHQGPPPCRKCGATNLKFATGKDGKPDYWWCNPCRTASWGPPPTEDRPAIEQQSPARPFFNPPKLPPIRSRDQGSSHS